jgi:hypothetical protein
VRVASIVAVRVVGVDLKNCSTGTEPIIFVTYDSLNQ